MIKLSLFKNTNKNIFATFANSSINNIPHLISSTYFENEVSVKEFINIKNTFKKYSDKEKDKAINNFLSSNFSSVFRKRIIQSPNDRRLFHSSVRLLLEFEVIDKKELENKALSLFSPINQHSYESNFTFSFLEKLELVLNDKSLSSKEKQYLIESSWIQIVINKLDSPIFLSKYNSNKLINVINIAFETLSLLNKKGQLKRRFPQFYNELNKKEYLMLTYSYLITYHSKFNYTNLCMIIADYILSDIYKKTILIQEEYRNINDSPVKNNETKFFIISNNYTSKKDFFIKNFIDNKMIAKIGDFFISILSTFPSNLFEKDYESDDSPFSKYAIAIIKLNSEYLESVKDNIIVTPSSLPMICIPEKWSDKNHGGLIENSTLQNSIITGSQHNHLVEDKENLYNAVNYMSSIAFNINKSLLHYLNNDGKYLLDDNINKSTKLQNDLTLAIANTFKNTPFYLNINSDWRGRLYTQSFFISYQASDLSSALLQFNEGEVLTDHGLNYLYIYGANNHNENNISKLSFNERISWIKDNLNKIINLDKDLILRAENKFVFTAFCLAVKSYNENPNTIIKLPVFLDATCSGIQHFSALMRDFELGSKVNLIPQNENDLVQDIYSDMIDPINDAINNYGRNSNDYLNLSNVKLTRKILKTSLMTKVYNVTVFGISEQIKNKLKKVVVDNITYYEHNGIYDTILLSNKDIFKISQIINEQVFILFPSLRKIYKFLLNMSKLCITLNIPLTWITPCGLKITQHYLKSKVTKVALTFGYKNKTMAIREWTDLLDKAKQNQAIIPNIIHSLDASHLINLINSADKNNFSPIITVHDCFGTLPNKMAELEHRVKKEFVLLYTQKDFLETFHNRIIQSIKDNHFLIISKDGILYAENNNKIYEIPELPLLGELD